MPLATTILSRPVRISRKLRASEMEMILAHRNLDCVQPEEAIHVDHAEIDYYIGYRLGNMQVHPIANRFLEEQKHARYK